MAPNRTRDPTAGADSTAELLDRARGGDPQAIDALFERHLGPLQRFARGRLPGWARDLADTDDLVQDALLQTFKRIDAIRVAASGRAPGIPAPGGTESPPRRAAAESARAAPAWTWTTLDSSRASRPLEAAVGRETMAAYEQALARLKPEEREAVIGRSRWASATTSWRSRWTSRQPTRPGRRRSGLWSAWRRRCSVSSDDHLARHAGRRHPRWHADRLGCGRLLRTQRLPTARLVCHLKAIAALAMPRARSDAGDVGAVCACSNVSDEERSATCIERGTRGSIARSRSSCCRSDPVSSGDRPASSIIEEGRLLARIRHPNVVTIYGAERIDERVGLWMEYVNGRTLHQLVAEDGRRFSPREIVAIGQHSLQRGRSCPCRRPCSTATSRRRT